MKKYQANYRIELDVTVEFEAEDDDAADEIAEDHKNSGADHLIGYGVESESIEINDVTQIKKRKKK